MFWKGNDFIHYLMQMIQESSVGCWVTFSPIMNGWPGTTSDNETFIKRLKKKEKKAVLFKGTLRDMRKSLSKKVIKEGDMG